MDGIEQSSKDTSFITARHEGAYPRWAIQIGTVDCLKWRGYNTLSTFLGRNSVEHSFTRLAKIWCDKDGKPLKNPDTGTLYPPITVRGELNPGAIDPQTGKWVGLRIDPHTVKDVFSFVPKNWVDRFNQCVFRPEAHQSPKCKLAIFPYYGDDIEPFDADYIVEEPVMIGDETTMESLWLLYQRRAARINEKDYDYDLVRRNCHTVNCALNRENGNAVKAFAERGFMRWGANPDAINIPEESVPVRRPLLLIRDLNAKYNDYLYASLMTKIHQRQQSSGVSQQPPDETIPAYEQ